MNNRLTHATDAALRARDMSLQVLNRVRERARALEAQMTRVHTRLDRMSAPSLSIKDQTFFIKRLSFLIRANVPILEGLHMVAEQAPSRQQKRVLESVIADIAEGQSLSKSLGRFPNIFGDFAINIIKVGESSGILSQNLEYLADELKKKDALNRKIVGASVYPAVIGAATLAITIFLMVYLFPKITPVFTSLHMALPLSTRIVMAASNMLLHYGIYLLAALVIAIVATGVAHHRFTRVRYAFDYALLRAPIIGSVAQSYCLANGARTLGLLLKSGITLSIAVPLTADTMRNLIYKDAYRELGDAVTRGEKISTYFAAHRELFPAIMNQMVSVGERSGNLSATLLYLAELYEGEVDDFTKNLSSLVEPVMMVVMGVVVGFIAISIITPIYGITQNLHG